jgi:hypothetical protein
MSSESTRPAGPARAATTLEDLPPEVLLKICGSGGALGIEDLRNMRLVARWLRQPVAGAARTLVARDCELPAQAWAAFPAARGLHIETSRNGGEERDAVQERLRGMMGALPAGRLERLSLGVASALLVRSSAAAQLVSRAPGLEYIGYITATAQAAAQLLRGLPSLECLALAIEAEADEAADAKAAPALLQHFPSGLTHLVLDLSNMAIPISVDGTALAACGRLRTLHLQLDAGTQLASPASLAALTALEVFSVDACNQAVADDVLTAACQMPQLLELNMGQSVLAWDKLASLSPSLRRLELDSLQLDLWLDPGSSQLPAGPPLGITSLLL